MNFIARIFCIILLNAYKIIYSTDNLDKAAKFQSLSQVLFGQQKVNNAYYPWTIACMHSC